MGIEELDWNPDDLFKIEAGLTAYLDQLQTFVWDGERDDTFDTASGEPFCGCDVCLVREVMAFLVPRIAAMVRDGSLWWQQD